MKKGLIAVTLITCCCFTGLALAAQAPVDVPKDHWAYAAIQALIKDGLISGYPDGTFKGDKQITRYEMSEIVRKALDNEDKATREQKALIDKLSIEFALELNKIDTRVKELEKEQSRLKIDGLAQFRYEYAKNPRIIAEDVGAVPPSSAGRATDKTETRTMFWLNVTNKFDGETYFHGMLASETLGGKTATNDLEVWEANFDKKIGQDAELGLGRFFPSLSVGSVGGAYFDGAKLSFGKDVKVNTYVGRWGNKYYQTPSNPSGIYSNYSLVLGDVRFNLNKDVTMALAYKADREKEIYNNWGVGLTYKGMRNLVLDGEYAANSSDLAKLVNSTVAGVAGSTPKAYFVRLKYRGANPFVVGSSGFKVQYKYADAGYDQCDWADPFAWNAPFNYTTPGHGGMADNIKGFEYSFEATLAPRTIFSMSYDKLKRVKNSPLSLATADNQDYFTAQVSYLF